MSMSTNKLDDLVTYIQGNASMPLAQIEIECMKTGYTKTEIVEALKLAALKQEKTASSISAPKSKNLFIVACFLCIGAVILTGAVFAYFGGTQKHSILPAIQPDGAPTPSIKDASPGEQTQPMTAFMNALAAANYSITTTGKVTSTTETLSNNKGVVEADYSHLITYVQNGEIVRLDSTDPEKPQTVLLKGENVYSLNTTQKTYMILTTPNEMAQFFLDSLKLAFPLIQLAHDTQSGSVTWQKTTETEWQADWHWSSPLSVEKTPVKVKINIDSTTQLINSYSIRFEGGEVWQDVGVQYEQIADIATLLEIPSDYTEEKMQMVY